MRRASPAALILLFCLTSAVRAQAPVEAAAQAMDDLIGGVLDAVMDHRLERDWQSSRMDGLHHLEVRLSVARQSIQGVMVTTQGVDLVGTRGGGVRAVVLEDNVAAPDRFELLLERGVWLEKLRPGARIALDLQLDDGTREEIFEGTVARLERVSTRTGTAYAVLGYRPEPDRVGSRRVFTDLRDSEVVELIATERGIPVTVEPSDAVRAETVQKEPDLALFRRLARRNGYDVYTADGGLRFEPSVFSWPEDARRSRGFSDMSASDVAGVVAAERGLVARVDPTPVRALIEQAQETDHEFLYRLGLREGRSFWIADGVLHFDAGPSPVPDRTRTRRFRRQTLGSLVEQVAREYGLRARVPRRTAGLRGPFQDGETTLAFLRRVAREHGFGVHVQEGVIVLESVDSAYELPIHVATRVRISAVPDAVPGFSRVAIDPLQEGSDVDPSVTVALALSAEKGEPAPSHLDAYRDHTLRREVAQRLAAIERVWALIRSESPGAGLEIRALVLEAYRRTVATRWTLEEDGVLRLDKVLDTLQDAARDL